MVAMIVARGEVRTQATERHERADIRHLRSKWLVAFALALGLTACGELATAPIITGDTRVAITTLDQLRPALFVGSLDGTTRMRLRFANITDSIPGNLAGLEATDDNLLALASPAFSPDGRRVALVATLAFDQSEVVVMNADGSGGKVASVNSQSIGSDVVWSPDGTKLAYTMSTVPGFGGFDVFVTTVAANTITRITIGANLRATAIRWSADGRSIFYAHNTGTTSDALANWISEVVRVDVATGVSQVVASHLVGQISSVGASSDRVLLTRVVSAAGGSTHQLVESMLGTSERTLLASDAAYAHYLSVSDSFALAVTATTSAGSITSRYFVMDVRNGDTTTVRNAGQNAFVDVHYGPLP